MTQVRTLRFHTKYGPAPLFDKAREQLKGLTGLSLEIPYANPVSTNAGFHCSI